MERNRFGTCTLGCLMLAMVGSSAGLATAQDDLPDSVVLQGIIRDFRDRGHDNGHKDFQWQPRNAAGNGSFGLYTDIVHDELDADGKPAFKSRGRRVTREWKDAAGLPILPPRPYIDPRPGDQAGAMEGVGHAVHDEQSFSQWFRDVPGMNVSMALPITLRRESGTSRYVFDDRQDPLYSTKGGFFPINGELYGNYGSTGKNFHFTFELETEFVFQRGTGQQFTFIGDDDVWVYIDGRLVIDLGGVHAAATQTIDLDRLNWLQDGRVYSLHFFFAERHTTQANFRIETTLQLRTVNIPTAAALYD